MSDPTGVSDGDLKMSREPRRRFGGLVQIAPGPEAPQLRDRAGVQAGMILALSAGGAFWTAVGAAIWFFRR